MAVGTPMFEPLLPLGGVAEELHLGLLEFPAPEREVPGRDLVTEGLADLRDPEWDFLPSGLAYALSQTRNNNFSNNCNCFPNCCKTSEPITDNIKHTTQKSELVAGNLNKTLEFYTCPNLSMAVLESKTCPRPA